MNEDKKTLKKKIIPHDGESKKKNEKEGETSNIR